MDYNKLHDTDPDPLDGRKATYWNRCDWAVGITRQVLTDFVDAYDVLREMEDEKEMTGEGIGVF